MTLNPGRKVTCPNCRREFVRESKPGRPRAYCGDNCRNQASRRKASGDETVPDPARHDALLAQVAEELSNAANNVLIAAQNPSSSADLLKNGR